MENSILLKISLDYSDPLIWREVVVRADIPFSELHHTIQILMNWQNYHIYEFNTEGYRIGMVFDDDIDDGLNESNLLNADTTLLRDIITDKGELIRYVYDFGDNWKHTIEVMDITKVQPGEYYPVCLNGEMACPPDDCGGIHEYYHFLEILNDKKHPEYPDLKAWMPRGFKADKCDLVKINKNLLTIKTYIKRWQKRNL